jgi:outer membrane biosynthesis protein TonB
MRRFTRSLVAAFVVVSALALAGCENFDIGDLFPDTKKKLPGERKLVFPEGVPGVPQGVPPELVKGYQPPPEQPPAPEVVEEKPKPKPKPKRTVQRPASQAQSQRQSAQQQEQQSTQQSGSPSPSAQQQPAPQANWPAPPPPGTFSR